MGNSRGRTVLGPAKSAKDLKVYQAAYTLAMEIFTGYLSPEDYGRLSGQAGEVGAMLGAMIKEPSSFVIKST
jgi:hypothetical protein